MRARSPLAQVRAALPGVQVETLGALSVWVDTLWPQPSLELYPAPGDDRWSLCDGGGRDLWRRPVPLATAIDRLQRRVATAYRREAERCGRIADNVEAARAARRE